MKSKQTGEHTSSQGHFLPPFLGNKYERRRGIFLQYYLVTKKLKGGKSLIIQMGTPVL